MAYFEKHMEFACSVLIISVGPASGRMDISSRALEWDSLEYRIFVDDLLYFTFKNNDTGIGQRKLHPFPLCRQAGAHC
jgi:hypothetical protein